MPNLNEIKQSVREAIGAVIGRDVTGLDDTAQLGVDVSVDSLSLTEVALKLESTYRIRFADEDYARLNTVAGIAEKITELIPADAPVATTVSE
jgi:acyl carrier protein